jgi:hypothetical protein
MTFGSHPGGVSCGFSTDETTTLSGVSDATAMDVLLSKNYSNLLKKSCELPVAS